MIFAFLDMIVRDWKEIEDALDKTPLKRKGQPISIERYGDKMRLCYNGRPLGECKTSEKIEAVRHLSQFYQDYIDFHSTIAEEARIASAHIASWVGLFQKLKRSSNAAETSQTDSNGEQTVD